MEKEEIKFLAIKPSVDEITYAICNDDLSKFECSSIKIPEDIKENLKGKTRTKLPEYLNFCRQEFVNLIEGLEAPIMIVKPIESCPKESSIFRAMAEGLFIEHCYDENYQLSRLKSATLKRIFRKKSQEIENDNNPENFPVWWETAKKKYREVALLIIAASKELN